MSALGQKQTLALHKRMSALGQKRTLDHTRGRLSGALNPQVDLAAKRSEIDRFGEKRFSAIL
jgi:hypothetical protein